jgi:hypothetical protein
MSDHIPSDLETTRVVERIDDLMSEVDRLRQEIEAARERELAPTPDRRRSDRRSGIERRTNAADGSTSPEASGSTPAGQADGA